MRIPLLLTSLIILISSSCKKDERYLWRNTGVWEIESMRIDYLNASGGVDSTVTGPISGMFIFYNTPTAGSNPVYLVTHGITVKGVEIHGAHYWRSSHKEVYMEDYNHVQFRLYEVSDKRPNHQAWDYTGLLMGLHTNTDPNQRVHEHIELKRSRWQSE